jgi:hypothetical protein
MHTGDRVRLTSRVARTLARRPGHGGKVNWQARRGVVTGMSNTVIYVRWDGRRSQEQWPRAALVSVDEGGENDLCPGGRFPAGEPPPPEGANEASLAFLVSHSPRSASSHDATFYRRDKYYPQCQVHH